MGPNARPVPKDEDLRRLCADTYQQAMARRGAAPDGRVPLWTTRLLIARLAQRVADPLRRAARRVAGVVALALGAVILTSAMAIDVHLGDPDIGIPMSAWPLVLYAFGVLGIGCALHRTPGWSVQASAALGIVLLGVLADVVHVVPHIVASLGDPRRELVLGLVGIAYVVSMVGLWLVLAGVLLRGTRLDALVVPLLLVAAVDVAWAVAEASKGDPMGGLATLVAACAVVSFAIAMISIADAVDDAVPPGARGERAPSLSDA